MSFKGEGGTPPPHTTTHSHFLTLPSSAILHPETFLHMSLTSVLLFEFQFIIAFTFVLCQIACFFWLVILFENLPSRTRLAFTSLWIVFKYLLLDRLEAKVWTLYFYSGSRDALWFKSDYQVVRLVNWLLELGLKTVHAFLKSFTCKIIQDFLFYA